MHEGLKPGLTGEAKVLVDSSNTAEIFGNIGAKVYATPMLVALMEQASMTHLAATPVGMTVTARAELIAVAGKKLTFDVTASDAVEAVGKCRHERYVVSDMAAFLDKVSTKQK